MRAGKLATIRINPADCLSIVDIIDLLKIPRRNMSFSQATKIALASMLDSLRISGTIPRREGFEYNEMMKDFPSRNDYSARGAQLKMAAVTNHPDFNVPGVYVPDPVEVERMAGELVKEPVEKRKRRILYDELMFKYQAAPESLDADDTRMFFKLMEEFQI